MNPGCLGVCASQQILSGSKRTHPLISIQFPSALAFWSWGGGGEGGGAEFIPVFFSCKAPVGLTVVMSEYQASYQHNAPRVYAACCPPGMELCLIQTMSLELRCDCLVLGVRKLRLTPFSGVSLPALHTGTTSTLSVLILWLLKLKQSLPPHPQHSMTMF